MRIESSSIDLSSTHTLSISEYSSESLRISRPQVPQLEQGSDTADFSASAPEDGSKVQDPELNPANGSKLQLLRLLLERLLGRKIHVIHAGDMKPKETKPPQAQPQVQSQAQAPAAPRGGGLEYSYQHTRTESETTNFQAKGIIRTADGKEVEFSVDLTLSREQTQNEELMLRIGQVQKDPLVLNFSGTAAQLSDTRFQFDLDADGVSDNVPLLGSGSAFLALDRNGNGIVDSGAELFGPSSGNGFAELSSLDADNNRWIDEGDPSFSELRLWTPAAEGNGTLQSLAQAGVGALYIGNVETPFSVQGSDNEQLGTLRASGVYVSESGDVGTMQQIDLSV
jgi:hypothetical protein